MRAAVIHRNGGLEELVLADIPEPAPGRGEVAIRVKAAGLNHLDIWMRMGRPGLRFNFPHPLGSDAAGLIHAIGEGVEDLSVGAEVVINPGIACMRCEWCLRGQHSECPDFGIVGQIRHGSFAEVLTVPAECVYPKPAHLSWEEAAALPLAHLTAWRMLYTRGQLQPGETVLIHGVGGGVALALLQLARASGAEVFVTSSSDEKLARARELGAAHTINYRNEDVAARVLEITDGRGVDICLDTVGAQTWPINFAAVRKAGRIVHCGITTGPTAEVQISGLYWRQLNVLGSTMGTHEEFRKLLRFVSATGLRPVMDSTYPLDEARAAQERMEKGEQFGKIALTI
jgi:NADPH:quinone reductase-like Zn-dependent oxidoreductase